MVDMPLWHRQTGPRNPEQTRDVDRTLHRLDALVDRLNKGVDRLEAIPPPEQRGRDSGDSGRAEP